LFFGGENSPVCEKNNCMVKAIFKKNSQKTRHILREKSYGIAKIFGEFGHIV
jgi:hypothetical protein